MDDYQIYTLINKSIIELNKTEECDVIYGEALFDDKQLVNYIKTHYISSLNCIFVPIYYDPSHWYLLIIDLKQNKSLILDSVMKDVKDAQYTRAF